jgi:hypothetical protein
MSELMRVLITVKAAPEPSNTYIDTVCVAGVRIDGERREWIRLYPVPFRHLSSGQQFKKYDVIEVETNPAKHDTRRESRRPVWDSLTVVHSLKRRDARERILAAVSGPNMCELIAAVQDDRDAQSLGLVHVAEFDRLIFSKHKGWTPSQQRAVEAAVAQPALFGESEASKVPLEPPRFVVKVKYRCDAVNCSGHEPSLLDFELAALQYHQRHTTDDTLRASIEHKFGTEQFGPDQRTALFVGNIADPPKRRSFSALGIHRVPVDSDWGSTLF